MDFQELCRGRRSVRKFSVEPLDHEVIDAILKIMASAPSAGNLQAYRVVAVLADAVRMRLADAAHGQQFIYQAPLALVFLALPAVSGEKYSLRGEKLFALQDATIACTYAMLAAHSLGLASVWVGSFEEASVAEIVGAKKGEVPVAILPVGYAAESPAAAPRKTVDDLVRRK